MNEVIKTIYNRKSLHKFSQDAVAIEDLKIIAEAGVWAPNSMNTARNGALPQFQIEH
ncbi:MAG: hypothetical protein V8R80_09790 [Eubacterium sp.]